ncbi:hypothetical protein [Clostridium sp. KNHs205]|uniref:hypothetical protein n=1 Tax=Clostridium sp. KNHs205 TaxID=1449050 RepID=UPI00051BA5E9|nr:hypothetical protein [Clostridium sp. KNHs205]
MKSDREFLNEVYQKAEQMKKEEENPERFKGKRKAPLRFALTAAAFLIFLSATYVFYNISGREPATPQKFNMEPRGINLPDYIQELLDTATEVAEVQPVENGTGTYRILKLYKHSLAEDILIKELTNLMPVIGRGETAIVFLNTGTEGLQLLDVFTGKEDTKDYVNSTGDVLTEERLEGLVK